MLQKPEHTYLHYACSLLSSKRDTLENIQKMMYHFPELSKPEAEKLLIKAVLSTK